MKTLIITSLFILATAQTPLAIAQSISLETAPPVVVQTHPVAGTTGVDPGLTEIRATFSKPMQDGNWSWVIWRQENFPELTGEPRYLADGRTCVVPVKLQPGKFYALWLNSEQFKNFKDRDRRPAVPYLLTFQTLPLAVATTPAAAIGGKPRLNEDQRLVMQWTDRQFRSFFDDRTFDGWAEEDVRNLEKRSIDALSGPRTREYYQAINTLGALRTTNGLPALRELAFDRRDQNNRDRWMAVRVLGLLGDQSSVPELIHLVYHGNVNTRWWAQIALVQITGENFGTDWRAWANWWTAQNGQPPFQPEIIRWWSGQPATEEELTQQLAGSDTKFLTDLRK